MMSTCVTIESLDQEGRGVARVEGKTVFVEGALPGEQVRIETLKKKPSYDIARVVAIDKASASRVAPRCPHFGVCGGCSLQHADPALQVAGKQKTLEDALERIGRVKPETLLPAIGDMHAVELRLQPGGPNTVAPFHPRHATLAYTLPEFDVAIPFLPTDFTQVNAMVNRVLVRRAVTLLGPVAGERIADFFCGLGNFSLPIARRGARVIGVEGNAALVKRAQSNAARNGLGDRVTFVAGKLFTATRETIAALGPLDRALIDPPREGAVELAKSLPGRDEGAVRKRIVDVSCNPATP